MKRRILFNNVEKNFEGFENGISVGVASKPVRVVQKPAVGHDDDGKEQVGHNVS